MRQGGEGGADDAHWRVQRGETASVVVGIELEVNFLRDWF